VEEHIRPTSRSLDAFWAALVEHQHDLEALLRTIAEHVVEVFGDGCVLTTVTADGTALHPRVVVHRDPEVAAAMQRVLGRSDVQIGEGLVGSVAETRRAVVLNHLDQAVVAETTPEPYLSFVHDHPLRALAVAPMVAGGELVGTVGAVRTSSDDPYLLGDLATLEALAERAALAVDAALSTPRTVGATDYEAVYLYSLDGVLVTTPDGHVLAANPAACRLLGRPAREIALGGREAVVVADDPELPRLLEERAVSGQARGELTLRRGDGSTFVADVSSALFTTLDGKVRASVVFRDVTEDVLARELAMSRVTELEAAATRDPLTGLWNRQGFTAAAEHTLAGADRADAAAHVVFLDVDRLKAVNDGHGHACGDAALQALSRAIDRSIREVDVAGRLGGDEFVVVLVGTTDDAVEAILRRVEHELYEDPAAPVPVTFSAGVVRRPAHSDRSLVELVAEADQEMYEQKVLRRARRADTA
jgi:diguanylate cyclase (GGDEF)-like protein/PAS domain S-box-containing protein